jgi:hypothetical protein
MQLLQFALSEGGKMTSAMYPGPIVVEQQDLLRSIEVWRDAFLNLARTVEPEVQASDEWTARDLAGHLLTVIRRYTARDIHSRDGLSDDPTGLDRINHEEVTALGDASMSEILDRIEREGCELVDRYRAPMDLSDRSFEFFGDVQIDFAAALANVAGEFQLHGRQLALAARRPWQLDDDDVRPLLNLVVQVAPAWVRDDAAEVTVHITIPEVDPLFLRLEPGRAEMRRAAPTDRADVRIKVPALTFLLRQYGHIGDVGAAKAGFRVVGGRRPWRILRLSRGFVD